MSRSLFRQVTQIQPSDTFNGALAAGATLESGSASIEGDLNALRSQVNRILSFTGGNWYDDISTVTSIGAAKQRALAELNTDLDDLEEKRLLFRTHLLADITVGAATNVVILGTGEFPTAQSSVAAVGAVTTEGNVVAQASVFGTAGLDEVAGTSAILPKNLVLVRDGTTGDPILSSNREIYGLLQSENGTDGHTITATTPNRVQISFVRINATGDDLELCPTADIENKTINYAYVQRVALDNVPEDAFLAGSFIDQAGSVDVTLQNAIDNQGGAVTQNNTIDINIADGQTWDFNDPAGSPLVSIQPTGGGDTVVINGDTLDVNSSTVDFAQGATFDSTGTSIEIGVTAGTIGSTGANNLRVLGAAELFLDDGNQTGSTWAQTDGIKLSETTAEWDTFEVNFGEVSLLNAMNQLYTTAGLTRTKAVAVATATVAADTDVSGPSGSSNLDADLVDYSGVTFLTDVDIYLNGQLLRNGADAAANNDVYPGTDPTIGELKFEFQIKGTGSTPDVITMIVWA